MKNIDSISHLQGKSIYLDDLPTMQGTLYCAIYDATIAHAKIKNLDLSIAEKSEGVVKIFTYKDINGANQIGGIILDEQLLAEDVVDFCGMPIALIVANTSEKCCKEDKMRI